MGRLKKAKTEQIRRMQPTGNRMDGSGDDFWEYGILNLELVSYTNKIITSKK
jgi:hypothetical protein